MRSGDCSSDVCSSDLSVIAPAATSAEYSPRLWPASAAGIAPPCCRHARHTATPAASSAGCVYSVRLSCSSGPPCDSAHRSTPAPSDASTNASRTSGCSSESSASIASDCEPCPGNTNASVEAVTHEPCEKASRDDTGEPAPASVPGRIDGGPGLGIWDWGFGKAGSRGRQLSSRIPNPESRLVTQQISEEHTSELQSLMRISYAVFCLKKKKQTTKN